MTFQILIAILMMAAIIILLFKEVSPPGVIFTAVPILAALLMGYSPREINGFIGDGLKSISGTLFLMVFAVLYFGILHEAGVFQALVRFVMHFLGNSVLGTLIVTCFVGMGTQLDGSGATTALCTIPAMKPIYDRQKIRPEALLLIESLASGVFCLLPWAPGIVEGSAYVGVDVFDVFTIILPVLIFSVILLLLFCIPVSIVEKRHGAGLSSDEFADLKKTDQPASQLSVRQKNRYVRCSSYTCRHDSAAQRQCSFNLCFWPWLRCSTHSQLSHSASAARLYQTAGPHHIEYGLYAFGRSGFSRRKQRHRRTESAGRADRSPCFSECTQPSAVFAVRDQPAAQYYAGRLKKLDRTARHNSHGHQPWLYAGAGFRHRVCLRRDQREPEPF